MTTSSTTHTTKDLEALKQECLSLCENQTTAQATEETIITKMKELEQKAKSVPDPTILLLGPTGAGKSTLINRLYGMDLAATGVGWPVTQDLKLHQVPGRDIRIYDWRGVERGSSDKWRKDTIAHLRKIQSDPMTRIHVVWYFVSMGEKRWVDDDEINCKMIEGWGTKNFFILSKCDNGCSNDDIEQMKKTITKTHKWPVFTTSLEIKAPKYCTRCNTDDLICRQKTMTWQCEKCGVKGAFVRPNDQLEELEDSLYKGLKQIDEGIAAKHAREQVVSQNRKLAVAAGIVVTNSLGAAAIGASPIPFSDAPLLAALQTTMLLELGIALGIPIWKFPKQVAFYGAMQFVAAFAGLGGASLLKLIPGVGTAVGMAVDAVVASTLTGALGTLYIVAMVKLRSVMKELELVLPSEELLRTVFSSVINKESVHEMWNKVKLGGNKLDKSHISNLCIQETV